MFAPQAGDSFQSNTLAGQGEDSLIRVRKQDSEAKAAIQGEAPGIITERDIKALGKTFRKVASPIERRLAFSKLLEGLTSENALLVRQQIAHLNHKSPEFQEFHYA